MANTEHQGAANAHRINQETKRENKERGAEEMAVVVSRYCSSRGPSSGASVLSTTSDRPQLPGTPSPGDRSLSSGLLEHCMHAHTQHAHIFIGETRVGCGGIRLQTHGTYEFLIATSSCISGLFHLSGLLWVLHSF